jgi:hypothetical protein
MDDLVQRHDKLRVDVGKIQDACRRALDGLAADTVRTVNWQYVYDQFTRIQDWAEMARASAAICHNLNSTYESTPTPPIPPKADPFLPLPTDGPYGKDGAA